MMDSSTLRIQAIIGLAQKAGKIASGEAAVGEVLKSGKVRLMVIAADAYPNAKRELYFLAKKAGVPTKEMLTCKDLGAAIGKSERKCLAVLDDNFVKLFLAE